MTARPGLLAGRVCAVTGGARGIGRAICTRFAEEGATVAICDGLDDDGESLREELRAAGADAEYVHVDVTTRASVEASLERVVRAFGDPDVVVANAGILRQAHVLDLSEETWDGVVAVNLTGVLRTCQVYGRRMVARGSGGRILITSSIAGLRGGEFYGAYAATKFAVIGLAQSLAVGLAPHGVLVNCVCPGAVDTQMMEQLAREQAGALRRSRDEIVARTLGAIPIGRYANAREVADVFVFLASPLSGYVTGQRLVADGGMLVT